MYVYIYIFIAVNVYMFLLNSVCFRHIPGRVIGGPFRSQSFRRVGWIRAPTSALRAGERSSSLHCTATRWHISSAGVQARVESKIICQLFDFYRRERWRGLRDHLLYTAKLSTARVVCGSEHDKSVDLMWGLYNHLLKLCNSC